VSGCAPRTGSAGIIGEFADVGMTDVVVTPTLAHVDQVDRLADLVLWRRRKSFSE
jgi:hypothetical protein